MNNFKRILSIIITISFAMTISTVIGAINDIEGHWAYDDITYLIDKGVISGDDAGVRPNDSITRAEFAKVINKTLGYNLTASEPFADINEEDWFYNDMLIAKRAGYMQGDPGGNVNPGGLLTRAEACVIYARILELDTNDSSPVFSDSVLIPAWALGSINALTKKEIILGYDDGEFKAGASMTRGEAFVTVVRTEKYLKSIIGQQPPINTASPEITTASTASVRNSSSLGGAPANTGGSSSGGSSSNGTAAAAKPSFTRVDIEDKNLVWEPVENALSYEVILKRTTAGVTSEITIPVASNTLNINSYITNMVANDKQKSESFEFAVRAKISGGYSAYSAYEHITVSYPTIAAPDDLHCQIEYDENGDEIIKMVWTSDPYADYYEVSVEFEDDVYTLLSVAGNIAVIPDQYMDDLKEEYSVKIQGFSNSADVFDSDEITKDIDIPLYGGGAGDSTNPYILKTARHFNNLKKHLTAYYQLDANIDLRGKYTTIADFGGSLVGKETTDLYTLTIDTPLFASVVAGYAVLNVKVEGNIEDAGSGNIGSFFKTLHATGTIENCVSEVNIQAKGNNVGGIIGYNGGGSSTITNVVNKGNITNAGAAKFVGGIAGYARNSTITKAENYGTIEGMGVIGGIIGYANGANTSIQRSFNKGDVKQRINSSAPNATGGIAGYTIDNLRISDCYNSGEISSESNYLSGGIVGGGDAGKSITIERCYNAGALSGTQTEPIYPAGVACAVNTVNCYYLADETDPATGALSDTDMRSLNNFTGFQSSVWTMPEGTDYYYPILK